MSRADELYIQTCKDILENGFYDTELEVRPHWETVLLPILLKNSVWSTAII